MTPQVAVHMILLKLRLYFKEPKPEPKTKCEKQKFEERKEIKKIKP